MNDRRISRALYWANGVILILVVVWMGWITASTIDTQRAVARFNENQITYVQAQNDNQICTQYDLTVAVRYLVVSVRKIGTSLGLPVEDIRPEDIRLPDVEGIDCDP